MRTAPLLQISRCRKMRRSAPTTSRRAAGTAYSNFDVEDYVGSAFDAQSRATKMNTSRGIPPISRFWVSTTLVCRWMAARSTTASLRKDYYFDRYQDDYFKLRQRLVRLLRLRLRRHLSALRQDHARARRHGRSADPARFQFAL